MAAWNEFREWKNTDRRLAAQARQPQIGPDLEAVRAAQVIVARALDAAKEQGIPGAGLRKLRHITEYLEGAACLEVREEVRGSVVPIRA